MYMIPMRIDIMNNIRILPLYSRPSYDPDECIYCDKFRPKIDIFIKNPFYLPRELHVLGLFPIVRIDTCYIIDSNHVYVW